jgi:hypothetical protein
VDFYPGRDESFYPARDEYYTLPAELAILLNEDQVPAASGNRQPLAMLL